MATVFWNHSRSVFFSPLIPIPKAQEELSHLLNLGWVGKEGFITFVMQRRFCRTQPLSRKIVHSGSPSLNKRPVEIAPSKSVIFHQDVEVEPIPRFGPSCGNQGFQREYLRNGRDPESGFRMPRQNSLFRKFRAEEGHPYLFVDQIVLGKIFQLEARIIRLALLPWILIAGESE